MFQLSVTPIWGDEDVIEPHEQARRVHLYHCEEYEPLVRLEEKMLQMEFGEYNYNIKRVRD